MPYKDPNNPKRKAYLKKYYQDRKERDRKRRSECAENYREENLEKVNTYNKKWRKELHNNAK